MRNVNVGTYFEYRFLCLILGEEKAGCDVWTPGHHVAVLNAYSHITVEHSVFRHHFVFTPSINSWV